MAELTKREIEEQIQALQDKLKQIAQDEKDLINVKQDDKNELSQGNDINKRELIQDNDEKIDKKTNVDNSKVEEKRRVKPTSSKDLEGQKDIDGCEDQVTIKSDNKLNPNVNVISAFERQTEKISLISAKLKDTILRHRPTVTITNITSITKVNFECCLGIKRVSEIPRFFDFEVFGKSLMSYNSTVANEPRYLKRSFESCGYGINETRVILKSVNITPPIHFSPNIKTKLSEIIAKKGLGAIENQESRVSYVMAICETLFLMILGCQVVVEKANDKISCGMDNYSGDCVTEFGMLSRKFIDQDVPVLPAAGYQNRAQYVYNEIKRVFEPVHRRMKIGELGNKYIVSNKATFTTYGCITDQWFATGNKIYLEDLHSRTVDNQTYVSMFQTLSFEGVSIEVESPTTFSYSIIPIWRHDECDGSLMILALQVDQQQKFINGLSDLLMSTNIIGFRRPADIPTHSRIGKIKDSVILEYLNSVISIFNDADFFKTLSLDMLTTWIDVEIAQGTGRKDALGWVFNVFNVILWYNMFPAIAVDCNNQLMFILFTSLQQLLSKEITPYLTTVGFAKRRENASKEILIQQHPCIFDKYSSITGLVTYPLLTDEPASKFGFLKRLHGLLKLSEGRVIQSRDIEGNQTPRIRNIRYYYQPWEFSGFLTFPAEDDEVITNNSFAFRLNLIFDFILSLAMNYKTSLAAITPKNSFGQTGIAAVDIQTLFCSTPIEDFVNLGHRFHCEIYRLRDLGQNSIFIPDDTFQGGLKPRKERPQLYSLGSENVWKPFSMQRCTETVKFELPTYLWLAMTGIETFDQIRPPVCSDQVNLLRGLQEEGILFGDILTYVNKFKFGNPGGMQRELLGISNQITALRSSDIFNHLAKIAGSDKDRVFSILVDNTAVQADNRAMGFTIALGKYKGVVPLGPNNLDKSYGYGRKLRLERQLTTRLMSTMSRLFIPETSPITLYTRGLYVQFDYVLDLDPTLSVNMKDKFNQLKPVILGWSPTLIVKQVVSTRTYDQTFLMYTDFDGVTHKYAYQDRETMPNIVIVVTRSTGSIGLWQLRFLQPFFNIGKLSFLLPDLLVIMNRMRTDVIVTADYDLENQFEDILTNFPSRRVTVNMYDTLNKTMAIRSEFNKSKWFYLLNDVFENDIILTGMEDEVDLTSKFKISPWYMWAYGVDGEQVEFKENERISNSRNDDNYDCRRLISKLDLGTVNLNNNLSLCEFAGVFDMPKVNQTEGGIYQIFLGTG